MNKQHLVIKVRRFFISVGTAHPKCNMPPLLMPQCHSRSCRSVTLAHAAVSPLPMSLCHSCSCRSATLAHAVVPHSLMPQCNSHSCRSATLTHAAVPLSLMPQSQGMNAMYAELTITVPVPRQWLISSLMRRLRSSRLFKIGAMAYEG